MFLLLTFQHYQQQQQEHDHGNLQECCLSVRRPALGAATKFFSWVPSTIWVLCIRWKVNVTSSARRRYEERGGRGSVLDHKESVRFHPIAICFHLQSNTLATGTRLVASEEGKRPDLVWDQVLMQCIAMYKMARDRKCAKDSRDEDAYYRIEINVHAFKINSNQLIHLLHPLPSR